MTLVLDASMALAWIFERSKDEQRDCARRALQTLTNSLTLVPQLWGVEVANGLLVGERRKVITTLQSTKFLKHLDRLPITVDGTMLAGWGTIMKIALRANRVLGTSGEGGVG
jgi:predicted nucleic acid-binding protein